MTIFSYPTTSECADAIITSEKLMCQRGTVHWRRFEDGFPNIFIDSVGYGGSVRGKRALFLADFSQPDHIFDQISVLYSLPLYMVKSLVLVLPYFPTGTMERVEFEGQVATAKTLARILSAIPLSASGPVRIVIFDIHALQERFYFGDNVIIILVSAMPLFSRYVKANFPQDEIAFAFPDDGACKRFGSFFKHSDVDLIICNKVRSDGKKIVKIKEGDPGGKHVFIIDDLVKTGGTLIECKDVLFQHGATEVSAFVTHGVFPEDSWRRFKRRADSARNFSNVITTDSVPEIAKKLKAEGDCFTVLSLSEEIAEIVEHYVDH